MFDEPGFGCTELPRVNEDETPRLSKGLEHECCQPKDGTDGGGGVRDTDGLRGGGEEEPLKHVLANPKNT